MMSNMAKNASILSESVRQFHRQRDQLRSIQPGERSCTQRFEAARRAEKKLAHLRRELEAGEESGTVKDFYAPKFPGDLRKSTFEVLILILHEQIDVDDYLREG
jgi:hypothetical protein